LATLAPDPTKDPTPNPTDSMDSTDPKTAPTETTTDPTTAPPDAAPRTPAHAWERPALAALLLTTALLYLWGLGQSEFANAYYSAAVQAGTQSWQALFFGSLDAGNVITVDKPPASLWVMGISGRLFGFSSWSMLVPQALMGVGSVALLYATVRRWSGPAAALFAGTVFALTPVAVLIFRFNNPDALLTLLVVTGAYCMVRACETASTRWLALAGAAVGAAFLAKMMQSFLVLPAFTLMYLLAAPTPLRRRIWQLLVAGGALAGTIGSWLAVVSLWPVSARPYIGGSATNSALELALGRNGFGRVFGSGDSAPAGGNSPSSVGGNNDEAGGIGRLFEAGVGEQGAWLLPAALIALVIGLWLTARAPRTDRVRASLVLWGGSLLLTGTVFTAMSGRFHGYYTVAMAPAIAALLAVTGRELWTRRHSLVARGALAVLSLSAGAWGYVLLDRAPSWHPEVRYAVVAGTVIAVALLLLGHRIARIGTSAVVAAMVAALIGSTGFAVATAGVAHGGNDATAGPVVPGGRPLGGNPLEQPSSVSPELITALRATTTRWAAAADGAQAAAPLTLASGRPVIGIGGYSGGDPAPTLAQFQQYVADGQVGYFIVGSRGGGQNSGGQDSGAPNSGAPNGDGQNGDGQNGDGQKAGGQDGNGGPGAQISTWVAANFTATTIGGMTAYDLTGG